MGIEASYRRISTADWGRLQQALDEPEPEDDPGRCEAYDEVIDTDEFRSSDRFLSIDKDWHALHCLLTGRISGPDQIAPDPTPLGQAVMGGTETAFDATYGKVRVLLPAEVLAIAEALDRLTMEELKARIDPEAFTRAKVYPNPRPGGWDLMELEHVLDYVPPLIDFFRAAAERGEVVLLSFD